MRLKIFILVLKILIMTSEKKNPRVTHLNIPDIAIFTTSKRLTFAYDNPEPYYTGDSKHSGQ